jgi:hypothetical protein
MSGVSGVLWGGIFAPTSDNPLQHLRKALECAHEPARRKLRSGKRHGRREEFLDVFELAEDAVINGDGTFVYQDRLWKVGDGVPGEQYDVYPERR